MFLFSFKRLLAKVQNTQDGAPFPPPFASSLQPRLAPHAGHVRPSSVARGSTRSGWAKLGKARADTTPGVGTGTAGATGGGAGDAGDDGD